MSFSFTVKGKDNDCRARRGTLVTGHGSVETPAFMTVGTRATVTGLDPVDIQTVGTQVVLGNTYHLMLRPGVEAFERVGGIHRFMGWQGPVLTDSGGFQIFSLAEDRTISERGARFRSYVDSRMHMLSPERSIEIQTAIGSDIMMVLDVCPDSRAEEAEVRAAMERTHRWALRSLAARTNPEQALFAIVQGGVVPSLRRESAAFLTEHAFDGFAMGGLAVGDTREQREAITALTDELLPQDKPRYLMGVGTPADLLVAIRSGVDMFDCMLPTHLAWQGTAFTSTGRVKITRGAYADVDDTLDADCPCRTCVSFGRSYLHHLFRCKEPLGPRLLALHNLTHYNRLMAEARVAIEEGRYDAFSREKLRAIDKHEHSTRRLGQAPRRHPLGESHEVVVTTDHAPAMLDRESGEVMHPIVGPLVESEGLYVGPSRLAERLEEVNQPPLVLLDVGLGAGSNANAAWRVSEARQTLGRRLHLVSLDRTAAALKLALDPAHASGFGLDGDCGNAARQLLSEGSHETEAGTWSLVLGELPGTLRSPGVGLADIVFWDPFSPKSNPDLWTVGAFKALREVCGSRATVHTYGAATATRAALLLAGFAVGFGVGSGSKKQTTVAAIDPADLEHPLHSRWLQRLERSSAPFPSDAPDDAMERIRNAAQFQSL